MESVSFVFRKHPEREPSGKLSILGASCCSAERMNAYVKRRNPNAPEVAELYLRQGNRYGVRGDVAYCQLVHESRCWTSELSLLSWAPLTLSELNEESYIEAQMQMLYTFATDLALPDGGEGKLRRQMAHLERAGWRGTVPCWEDLNGKWPASGNRYGQDIVAMWRSMVDWKGKGEVTMDNSRGQDMQRPISARGRIAGSLDWSSFSSEEMKWLKAQQLLPSPAPHPDQKVTWSELAVLLRQWENRGSTATIE
ncbi:hypothetical protein [Cohnella abietis]|uniref:Uncharacterized protein n=1 Tax=Cohnella abietis TaxID=2507935 RepID=A0A3T1CY66_9BACL|nr:hypothetical protein [Cohnella abietis]BBI30786.1 hypothetical protein KCTCHS21_01850 [Cohnella abietis]